MDGWRGALDDLAAAMRELEARRPEVETLRGEATAWRRRAEAAEQELALHRARLKLKDHFAAGTLDPALTGVTIQFGQTEGEAVPVPSGPGNAQFLFGLYDLVLRDDRPIYFRVERLKPAPGVAVAADEKATE